jgi:hypothetical protein
MNKTVYILGAGFSKSAKAPLQSEILNEIFRIQSEDLLPDYREIFIQNRDVFKNFLAETMFIAENNFGEMSLEDIYTPIDRCIADNLSFRNISPKDLIDLRQKINGLIIIMLTRTPYFTRTKGGYIENFTDYLIKIRKAHRKNDPFAIISTNWDILVDNSLKRKIPISEGIVDYCCHTTPYEKNEPVMPGLLAQSKGLYNIKILKLHGSMNWLHCKRCQRLFVTFFEKIAIQEYVTRPICRICKRNFIDEDSSDGGAFLSSQLIMPTFLKDLNNVQLKLIWQNAGIELSESSKIVFMGYSFPMADFELRQLLARNVRHNAKIEVVLRSQDKPKSNSDNSSTAYRYKSFFGKREITMFYDGVESYVRNLKD